MPHSLEALDAIGRRLEQGEISALEPIDTLLSEELTLRENSRIKTKLRMARLSTIKIVSSRRYLGASIWLTAYGSSGTGEGRVLGVFRVAAKKGPLGPLQESQTAIAPRMRCNS
jgi:hypothetical protein